MPDAPEQNLFDSPELFSEEKSAVPVDAPEAEESAPEGEARTPPSPEQRAAVIAAINQLIRRFDLQRSDFRFPPEPVVSGQRKRLGATYVSPYDERMVWNGLGRRPWWFHRALAEGYTAEMMRVQ